MSTARPTLADVARQGGVSTALVSIVMRDVPGASDSTRERVRRIAAEMGYVREERARKLRQSTSRLIGVTFDLQQPFHGDLVEHLYRAAAARGYDLAISAVAPSRDEDTAIQALLRERCEAAVLLGSMLDDAAIVRVGATVPLLLVARGTDVAGVSSVRADDRSGVGLAVDHLVDLGHRRIAHVDGGAAPGSADRRAGFLDAAHRLGVADDARVVTGGLTEEDGSRGMRGLLDSPTPPTAVVAFNDRCAAGVLDLLVRKHHDVPGEISVIGYDDSRLATGAYAKMSTVSQNAEEMAACAIAGTLELVGGGAARDVALRPRLVVRATTGPVRSG